MTSSDSAETERVIRQKLEASGQYGKMRAMIMEAALHAVQTSDSDASGEAANTLFTPSAALTEAKTRGVTELSIVLDYLRAVGLQYTESVLRLEAGLADVDLHTSADLQRRLGLASSCACLTALVQGGGGGTSATPTQPTAVVEEPADTEEEEEEVADTASDHHQPGGEDSTYFISNWTKRHFMRYQQVSGQQVQLDRLMDCSTVVLDELDSMTADDCEGGELVIAACEGSVFLRNCKNMTVHVACKQLRTRDCENINLHIFTTTDPVVEMSHNVHFYPFHLRLPGLRRLFAEARLDAALNRFVHVYDFTPSEPGLPQPHFQVHFPDHQQSVEERCASYGTPECPPEVEQLLALQLMPAASSESGKNKSYDIKTGAQVWAASGVGAAAAAAAAGAATAAVQAATTTTNTTNSTGSAPKATVNKSVPVASGSDHSSVHSSSVSDVDSDTSSDDSDDTPAAAAAAAATNGTAQKRAALDPHVGTTAGAAVPMPAAVATPAGHVATPGGVDNEAYSSFDDESDAHDADDTYEVDEDEDDF